MDALGALGALEGGRRLEFLLPKCKQNPCLVLTVRSSRGFLAGQPSPRLCVSSGVLSSEVA